MKILLVTETVPGPQLGGLGKHVVALGNSLIEQGHEVVLMGRAQPSYESCADEIGFNGRFLAGFDDPFKGWKERLFGAFVPGKRRWYSRKIALGILSRSKDFDVVHYHGLHPMVGRFIPTTVPFVQTRHDQSSDCVIYTRFKNGGVCASLNVFDCASCASRRPKLPQRLLSGFAVWEYRVGVKAALGRHFTIFVSNFLKENCFRSLGGFDKKKVFVIHNSIDKDLFDLSFKRRRIFCRAESPVTTTIHVAARLDPSKGVGVLLRTLVPRLPPGWKVNVFGDGPERTGLMESFSSEQVVFHGHSKNSVVIEAAVKSKVAIVPSVWEEPFGVATLEVLRLGLPCYALNRGGTPELTAYASSGQLKLFENIESLVDALVAETNFECFEELPDSLNDWIGEVIGVYEKMLLEKVMNDQ